jgi:branched-chain amino acid transport system substrate-binding protein
MEIASDMSSWRRWLIAAGTAVLLAACTGAPSTERSGTSSSVRIGLLAPLSGPRATSGRDAVRGAQLAADLVNQASPVALPLAAGEGLPRLGGATLRIESADTGGDPQRAAAQANRLVAQRVAGLVSVGDTGTTAATSEQTERVGMLFVDGGGSANFLSERGMAWYFRTGPNDRLLGEQLLSLLQQTGNGTARKLAIVHSGDSSGTDMSVALEGLAEEGGYTVVADAALPGQGRDVAAVAREIRDASPDALIAATTQPADSSALLGGFRAIGWSPPVTMGMGAGFALLGGQGAIPGDATVLRSIGWSMELARRNPVAGQVTALYQRRFGTAMTETAARAFTATLTLAQAIDAAGSVNARNVRAALLGLQVPGRDTIMPWNGIRFDESGQNTQAAAVVEQLSPAGARVVFPPELAAPA